MLVEQTAIEAPARRAWALPAALGRMALLGFVLGIAALLLIGAGRLVYVLYPVAALGVAALLYLTHRGRYVAFVLWLWMLSPFVRRVVDYQTVYHETSIVQLAPILAAAVALLAFVQKLPMLYRPHYLPFLLVVAALLWGYFVGVINSGVAAASYDLLLWLVPVGFGFAIASDWRSYPLYRDAVLRSFLIGTAVIGAYGVWQYFFLPPWDAFWMRSTSITSIGLPFPEMVRVFGTLNSPVAYGAMVMAGLIVAVASSSWLRYPAVVFGLGGFALGIVRTSWLGFLVGVAFLLATLGGRQRLRLLLGGLVLCLIAVPVLTTGTIGERFMARVETFGDVEQDKSYAARSQLYDKFLPQALGNVVGNGIGAAGVATKLNSRSKTVAFNIDSGLLFIPYTLGWPGAVLMLVAVGALMLRPPGVVTRENVVVVQTATAICVALIAMMVSYNSMYGVGGMIFWTFLGLRFAARRAAAGD